MCSTGIVSTTESILIYKSVSTWIIDSFNKKLKRNETSVIQSPKIRTWWGTTVEISLETTYKSVEGYGNCQVGQFNISVSPISDESEDSIEGTYQFRILAMSGAKKIILYDGTESLSPFIYYQIKWANYDVLKLCIEIQYVPANIGFHYSPFTFLFRKKFGRYKEKDTVLYFNIASQNGQVKASKAALAAISPVFEAMFKHDCKETLTNVINIDDFDLDTIKEFVNFSNTYENPVFVNVDSAKKLFMMARKYQVESLKNICADYIHSEMDTRSTKILDDLLS